VTTKQGDQHSNLPIQHFVNIIRFQLHVIWISWENPLEHITGECF